MNLPVYSHLPVQIQLILDSSDAKCFLAYDVARLEPDSDIRAILDGYVSVAPMSMDLTSRIDIAGMDQAWK